VRVEAQVSVFFVCFYWYSSGICEVSVVSCVLLVKIHVLLLVIGLRDVRDSNERTSCLCRSVSCVLWCTRQLFMASGIWERRVHTRKFHIIKVIYLRIVLYVAVGSEVRLLAFCANTRVCTSSFIQIFGLLYEPQIF
jgi:hypothetical protein